MTRDELKAPPFYLKVANNHIDLIEDRAGQMITERMDLREQKTREALIALGWTPPDAPTAWLPIETAPSDDTGALVLWDKPQRNQLPYNAFMSVEDLDHDSDPQWWKERGATHWMPLPDSTAKPVVRLPAVKEDDFTSYREGYDDAFAVIIHMLEEQGFEVVHDD